MHIIVSILLNSFALIITDWLLDGFYISDFKTAVLAAIVIGLMNTFIKPFLMFLAAPLTILTLGLFAFVVNAIVLALTSWILGPNFTLDNFWWAILAAVVLSLTSTALAFLEKDLAGGSTRKKKSR